MQIYWNKRKSLHKVITTKRFNSDRTKLEHQNAQPPFQCFGTPIDSGNSGQKRNSAQDSYMLSALLIMADVTSYENTLYSQFVQRKPTSRCCSNHGWCMSCTCHLPHSISMSCKASCSTTLNTGCLVGILETWNNLEKCHKTFNCFPYHNHNQVIIIFQNQVVSKRQ